MSCTGNESTVNFGQKIQTKKTYLLITESSDKGMANRDVDDKEYLLNYDVKGSITSDVLNPFTDTNIDKSFNNFQLKRVIN